MNQTVHDTTETAKDKARDVGSQVQDQARSQVDDRSTQAGEQLQGKADDLHAVGDQMRERGDDTFAQVADRVAGWTEDAARYLREADADRMLGDVESFARRQPWAVAAGGALIGFAASRIVRAGSDRRQQSSSLGYGSSYEPLERDVDLRGTDSVSDGRSAGFATTGAATGAGYLTADPLGSDVPATDPLTDDLSAGDNGFGTPGYGTRASIAPEPGHDTPPVPDVSPVPDVDPVPSSDPSPLGDPVPDSRPEPSTGFYRPADVDR
ncbi:hypothetical protein [Jannaschia sp. R86511]|uniref:hypothetical protein n=1 Tax=Jannaschia sp. R86511 TaxID=3093853 RepID=UPI0036D2E9C7